MRRDDREEEHEVVVREIRSGGVGTFLAGIAIGAVVALLVAPQSGADTRREIRNRADRARKRAIKAAEDFGGTVRERVRDARDYVEDELEAAKHVYQEKKRGFSRAVDAGREAARHTRENIETQVAEARAAYEAGADSARSARRGRNTIDEDQESD